jgi:hypothetical protein
MKKIKRILFVAVVISTLAFIAVSCSPEFSQGFREGWNSTAPAEYRY